ncbi:MAG: DUF87 domain-containing protein [Candidatus Marsarchaeota archaeon]|jgi:hypothetical protein|nr:DUF87 domain-containing protein [Candidatus Marsarchaeota archaeon]MCL5418777.1 DUF87 domain-containing protein [Candidatus Marsarchaeota archaeon]
MKINLVEKFYNLVKKEQNGAFSIQIGFSKAVLKKVHGVSFQYQKAPVHEYSYRWKRFKKRIGICPESEPNPHMVIAGMSGAGKSTLLRSMLTDMKKWNVSCLLFDSNNEHEALVKSIGGTVIDASREGINLLELGGSTIGDRIDELTSLFKSVFNLGYLQAMKLNSCLWYTYMRKGARSRSEAFMEREPTVYDLLEELSVFIKLSKSVQESNSLRSMYQKLATLQRGAFRNSGISMGKIAHGISSFSLARIGNERARLIYITELVKRLYSYMHTVGREHGISMYVVLDESQLILGDESGARLMGNIIEEGRKFGFGAIIVSHMASKLDRRIIANASTFMSFYAKEPGEVSYVASLLSGALPDMQNAIKEKLRTLGKHEALLTSSSHRMPVLVSTARLLGSDSTTGAEDARIISMLAQPMKRKALEALVGAPSTESALQRLTIGKAVDSFVADGEEWLMRHSTALSIEHEVRIRKIAEKLQRCGIECRINTSYKGPDIVARAVAIEYETGLKSIDSTKRMVASRSGFRKTIVIVNDTRAEAYKSISNSLPYSAFIEMDCTALHRLLSP